jgi:crotonobetainyl-CoA:carnitine CoA-transferase CaiB-like acyl-CoA transferase
LEDPQVRHLGTFYAVAHPTEGDVCGVNPPVFLDGARPGVIAPPPTLGEHTDSVRQELGLTAQEIADLRARKVV